MKIVNDFKRYRNGSLIYDLIKIFFNLPFLAILFFRIADFFYTLNKNIFYFPGKVLLLFSKIITGIEIELGAKIGGGLKIAHGSGIVIGSKAIVGKNVTIMQGVTLGGNFYKTGTYKGQLIECPVIENDVFIGPGAKILGPVVIGDESLIGANSVITKSFEKRSLIIGNPGKLIRKLEDNEYTKGKRESK